MLINSKKDLLILKEKNPKEYDKFLSFISDRYEYQLDVQDYPEDYRNDDGEVKEEYVDIEPVYETRYRDDLLTKFGLTKTDIGR